MIIDELQELEQESILRGIPIVGREKGFWLLQKIQEIKPQKILELGTANGYSGIILGSQKGELTTIEINEKIAAEAEEKKEFFDLIFIDFAKRKYLTVLEDCITLVKRNGFIIADNITMEGCQDFKEAVLTHPKLKTEIINIKDGLSCSEKMSSLP